MVLDMVIMAGLAGYVWKSGFRFGGSGEPAEAEMFASEVEKTETVAYANLTIGFAIDQPSDWKAEDGGADAQTGMGDVVFHPATRPYVDGQDPEYLHIRVEEAPLETLRRIASDPRGGNQAVEAEIDFSGEKAYLYVNPTDVGGLVESGGSVADTEFRSILVAHNGKTYSIYTQQYFLPEVRAMFASFRFVD